MAFSNRVKGSNLKISVMAKGGGSENCSRTEMLLPVSGKPEIEKFVLESVKKAGANACPPMIIGLGIGGSLEKAAILSKKALLSPINKKNPDKEMAVFENELTKKLNKLGIGPSGLGGKTTVLGVRIEKFPCHIASFTYSHKY